MDQRRFDQLTRVLAAGTTRRQTLKWLAGSALAGMAGVFNRTHTSAAERKVAICHRTGSKSNPFVYLEVAESAVPAHRAHGDTINPDLKNDPANCGSCGHVCDDGNPCTLNQ